MKATTAIFIVIGVALGYYVFNGQKSVTDMVQDEIKREYAAPVRSERPL
jgi:hypothetical protein